MICPKCGGKSGVRDTIQNPDNCETYRRLKCLECGNIFYTTESVIDYNETFGNKWAKYARHNDKNRERRKKKTND